MHQQYPSRLLEQAVSEISKLPGIGRKTALRLVLHLLRKEAKDVHALSKSLTDLADGVKYCRTCHNISDTDECDICANPSRDRSTICVVENIQNALEMWDKKLSEIWRVISESPEDFKGGQIWDRKLTRTAFVLA